METRMPNTAIAPRWIQLPSVAAPPFTCVAAAASTEQVPSRRRPPAASARRRSKTPTSGSAPPWQCELQAHHFIMRATHRFCCEAGSPEPCASPDSATPARMQQASGRSGCARNRPTAGTLASIGTGRTSRWTPPSGPQQGPPARPGERSGVYNVHPSLPCMRTSRDHDTRPIGATNSTMKCHS